MNINYFGMHPKIEKFFWDGSQLKAFPIPDQPTLVIFFYISLIPNQIKKLAFIWSHKSINLAAVKVKVHFAIHCKIVLKWSWLLAQYVFCFGLISVCISQNNHKVVTKGSQTDPKVVTMRLPSKWSPSGSQLIPQLSPNGCQLTDWSPSGHSVIPTLSPNDPKLIPNWSQIDLKLVSKWPQNS